MCPRLFDWRWRLVLSGEEETRICRIKSRMRMKSSSGVVRYGGINLRQRRNTGCLAETRYRFLYLFVYDESFLRLYTMDITSIEMYITEMCIAYFFFFLIRGSRDVIYPIVYVYDIRWQPVTTIKLYLCFYLKWEVSPSMQEKSQGGRFLANVY